MASATLRELLERPEGREVRLVFRHFPLRSHPRAMDAAIASLAAHEQGRFWDYHDEVFGATKQLDLEGRAFLHGLAKRLDLDMIRFEQDCDHPRLRKAVEADQQVMRDLDQEVVPTMFVNGRRIKGAMPLKLLIPIVEEERARAEAFLKRGVPRGELYEHLIKADPSP